MGINPMQMKAMVIQGMIDSLESQDKKEKLDNIDLLGKTIGIGAKTGLEKQAIDALTRVSKEPDEEVQKAAEEALSKIKKQSSASRPSTPKSSASGIVVGDLSSLVGSPVKTEGKKKTGIKKSTITTLIILLILFAACLVAGVVLFLGS